MANIMENIYLYLVQHSEHERLQIFIEIDKWKKIEILQIRTSENLVFDIVNINQWIKNGILKTEKVLGKLSMKKSMKLGPYLTPHNVQK